MKFGSRFSEWLLTNGQGPQAICKHPAHPPSRFLSFFRCLRGEFTLAFVGWLGASDCLVFDRGSRLQYSQPCYFSSALPLKVMSSDSCGLDADSSLAICLDFLG